jgi:hypothetical protein
MALSVLSGGFFNTHLEEGQMEVRRIERYMSK